MTIDDLINQVRAHATQLRSTISETDGELADLRSRLDARDSTVTENLVSAVATRKRGLRDELERAQERIAEYEAEKASDEAARANYQRMGVLPSRETKESGWVRSDTLEPATIGRGQRFADHQLVSRHAAAYSTQEQAVIGQHGGIGNMIRAMTTTSGSALVPTVWAGDIIDRARNLAAVTQAGAAIVPMDAKTVQIGRLTTDPDASFRAEGSTVGASDPVFDNVTLTAKTMSTLIVGSLEWFQDSPNVDAIVSQAIAQAIAHQLDLTALYGGITTGASTINLPTPPNPRGVLATLNAVASSSVLGAATNGTTQTTASYFDELLDTLYTPLTNNEKPNALIYNSKLALQYAKAYDSTGQPLAWPADLVSVDKYTSNQVPSYTQGTMTSRATDVFAGDWTQLLIGQRLGLTIQTLTERYAEVGSVGIVAHWRGDIGVARPRAFCVYKALRGAL